MEGPLLVPRAVRMGWRSEVQQCEPGCGQMSRAGNLLAVKRPEAAAGVGLLTEMGYCGKVGSELVLCGAFASYSPGCAGAVPALLAGGGCPLLPTAPGNNRPLPRSPAALFLSADRLSKPLRAAPWCSDRRVCVPWPSGIHTSAQHLPIEVIIKLGKAGSVAWFANIYAEAGLARQPEPK